MDCDAAAFGNSTADLAEIVRWRVLSGRDSSEDFLPRDAAELIRDLILEWVRELPVIVEVVEETESVLWRTRSTLAVQSSGRPRLLWAGLATSELSLRGAEIEGVLVCDSDFGEGAIVRRRGN
jgi:hypothetical protein